MLKFAPKNAKQIKLARFKEQQIYLYKMLLPFVGYKGSTIPSSVWKYFFNFHIYYKTHASFSRSRKTCSLTGRSRSIYRFFQLSRIKIRETASSGLFVGVSKSS